MNLDQPYLDQYDGQSIEELIALEGQYRTDSLVLTLEQAIGIKWLRAGDTGLTEHESIVLAVRALEREVKSGGYWQFFAGSASEFAPSIVGALHQIGCPLTADVTARAKATYRVHDAMAPSDIAAFVQDQDPDAHVDLELAYHSAGEDLIEQLFEFVKANPTAFQIP